ncbi:MAG: hypothetical protein ACKPCM_16745, partial [Pseudanabaena sp.]
MKTAIILKTIEIARVEESKSFYSNPKSVIEIIVFDFAQPSVYRWLSEVEATHDSFRLEPSLVIA